MLDKIKRVDWLTVAILAVLMVASTALIYSATHADSSTHYIVRNLENYMLGFFVFFLVSFLDYRLLIRIAPYLYATGIILLVAVYFFGHESHGARSWFQLPLGFNFQPAELEKLILIISIAGFTARLGGRPLELVRDVLPIGAITFVPFILVMVQPDLGNAIIYLIILSGMLWIGNIKVTYVAIGTTAIALFLFGFFYLYTTFHEPIRVFLTAHHSEHWMERIDTFMNPGSASDAAIYQVKNAKIAIGSGGLQGEGYMSGNSVQRGLIPLPESDSIFVVIGEEFGFLGAAALLLLYFLLIYRMILISIQTLDLSGSLIIIGIVSMMVFQIFENIGMLLGIMPLTGITLPFISYGGTSVMINMMCLGLVNSIRVHQEPLADF